MQNVRIVRSRRKTLAIEVRSYGEILVRAPLKLAQKTIELMLREKEAWIRRKMDEMQKHNPAAAPHRFEPGETFPYRGQTYPLIRSSRANPPLALENGRFVLSISACAKAPAVFEAWYRTEARRIFGLRLDELCSQTGLKVSKLRLSSARTRWGSYSTSGTLSLNWRLVLAPPEILDYVIFHELAHVKIRNHSRNFWAEVERMHPSYKQPRLWLKQNGRILFFY
jgi:hypothetical protein